MTNLDTIRRQIAESIPWRDGVLTVAQAEVLVAEVERLRAENSKLRDVLGWVETQCPGKCAGVGFHALSGEHRRKEKE